MKSRSIILSLLIVSVTFLSYTNKQEIGKCYISFTAATNLVAAPPDRLPETSEKVRMVPTASGEVEITLMDGYRVLYNNEKNVPFVNLKVELSEPTSYETDQARLLENLRYLHARSTTMETKKLIELEFNGYKIVGLSRGTIEAGSTLGTFLLFPGNGVIVYFYFNNLKPGYRNFESLEDYKMQRDRFFAEYTKHLNGCQDK